MATRLDAVLLDRDGTINAKAEEGDYITSPEQLVLLPGAAQAIRLLNRAGVPAVVVTNQRGVARGRMSEADLEAVHTRLFELLDAHDARLDAVFYCPHDTGACACRKPAPLMLLRARALLGLDTLRHSVMVGDAASDVEAGRRAGARTVLLDPQGSTSRTVRVAPTLLHAVRRQLARRAPVSASRSAAAVAGPGIGRG